MDGRRAQGQKTCVDFDACMHCKGILFSCRPVITNILTIFQKANLWNLSTALAMRTIVVVDVQAFLFVLLANERRA